MRIASLQATAESCCCALVIECRMLHEKFGWYFLVCRTLAQYLSIRAAPGVMVRLVEFLSTQRWHGGGGGLAAVRRPRRRADDPCESGEHGRSY